MNPQVSELLLNLNGKAIVLSTSANDIVTSRVVSVIAINDSIYFASANSLPNDKNTQIAQNPNVAICLNTIQITGKASNLGLITSENNQEILNTYKEVLPHSYDLLQRGEYLMFKVDISTYKDSKIVDGKPEYIKYTF